MFERPSINPLVTSSAPATRICPNVADLIDYALGDTEHSSQIEAHLNDVNCSQCRNWIASVLRTQESLPRDSGSVLKDAQLDVRAFANPPRAPTPTADATPFPVSSKVQKQVFADLAARLRLLDEG